MSRKYYDYFCCNKPAGFRGRCVKLPNHDGGCSVANTPEVRLRRAQEASKWAQKLCDDAQKNYK